MASRQDTFSVYVSTLLSASASSNEQETVTNIDKFLAGTKIEEECSTQNDLLDTKLAALDKGNPYPEYDVVCLLNDGEVLNKFTCYVFERRFGWSEAGREGPCRVRRMSCTGATLETSDGQVKARLNDILDNIIKWFLHQGISDQLLDAFHFTLRQVSEMPVVRNRTVVHLMEWLRENKHCLMDLDSSDAIVGLLVISATDVWSAIRSACAKQLGQVIIHLSPTYQEVFFMKLVKICKSQGSTWQAKEGAIMGINSVVHQYQERSDSRVQTPQFKLEMDSQDSTKRVPSYVTEHILDVVFSLISHPQLTIRENAAKALSTYISSSDKKETMATFERVIVQLQNGRRGHILNGQTLKKLQLPVKYLDAYAAEGLLNVCSFLIKVVSLQSLLPQWPNYVGTFLLYLSHPASTVRQATSNIFKYLVSKCSHCAVLIKQILQILVEGWTPDHEFLQREEDLERCSSSQHNATRPSVMDNTEKYNLMDTWESKEGRLLAYELILKFLIKNHWLYTFGPAAAGLYRKANTEEMVPEEDLETQNTSVASGDGRKHSAPQLSDMHENPPNDFHVTESDNRLTQLRKHFRQVQFISGDSPNSMKNFSMSTEERIHGGNSFNPLNITYSVLMQLQVLDKLVQVNCKNNKHTQIDFADILSDSLGERLPEKVMWLKEVELTELKPILVTMLYQSLECLGDNQWELLRIAQQVLPCLAEIIRWYDISILEELWTTQLPRNTSLLTYGAALLLKESIVHSVKLQPLLLKPPSSWQNHDFCKKIISNIINSISSQLPVCLPYLDKIVQRPTYDRLSVIAAVAIVVAHTHFSIPSDQRFSQVATVISFWKLLFSFTHPNIRISTELLQGSDIRLFSSPFEGYLSCCLVKPDSKQQCAKQVEKTFINDVHTYLKGFLQNLPVESVTTLLPVCAHYTGIYIEDTHVCKTMSECIYMVGSRVVEFTMSLPDEKQKRLCLLCLHFTLKELASIITLKSAEQHLVQKMLNCYLLLCKPINPVKYLRSILVALCSRINEDVYLHIEHSPRHDSDLSLLSNDIPLSGSMESIDELDVDDAVIVDSPRNFPECLTLNLSSNSLPSGPMGSLSQGSDISLSKSPRARDQADKEDTDSSDWDSWDEDEDEVLSALTEAFKEFLRKLKKNCVSGSTDLFEGEVKKLATRERSLIRELLD